MKQTIRAQLLELAEPEYQKFSSKLLPNIDNVLGVRLPKLRKLAKQIAKEEGKEFLIRAEDFYFEELMPQGFVIGYLKEDIETVLELVADFVPKINSWSVCDSFCSSLKIAKENEVRVWEFLQPYFSSQKEYEVRFGVVMLLIYFMKEEYLDKIFEILDEIRQDGYYVKMAVAWEVSMCYVNFPERTLAYLKENRLDDFTYHKSLQKIVESLKVSKEEKFFIKSLKRNEK